MYVLHLAHPNDLDPVCAFLRSVQLRVHVNSDGTISVTAPGAQTPLHEQREVTGYITTWNALNPGNPITLAKVD